MAIRHQQFVVADHEHDHWSMAWGDPALQALGRWLVGQDVPDLVAANVVDSVWVFYSYELLPTTRRRLPIGIGVGGESGTPLVVLFAPAPGTATLDTPVTSGELRRLGHDFDRLVEQPLNSAVSLQLVFVPARSSITFEAAVLRRYRRDDLTYLGIFADNLEDELRTIMRPEDVAPWLATPNLLFADETPADALGQADGDRRLRDLILAAKHGLPA